MDHLEHQRLGGAGWGGVGIPPKKIEMYKLVHYKCSTNILMYNVMCMYLAIET